MASVRILVDGRLALTTNQAAAEFGVGPSAIRMLIMREAVEPVALLDGRTPLYAAVPLRRVVRARPGRGANLRNRRAT